MQKSYFYVSFCFVPEFLNKYLLSIFSKCFKVRRDLRSRKVKVNWDYDYKEVLDCHRDSCRNRGHPFRIEFTRSEVAFIALSVAPFLLHLRVRGIYRAVSTTSKDKNIPF